MKNKIIVSYQKQFDNNGTCYTQTIKINKNFIRYINKLIEHEKENNFNNMALYNSMGIFSVCNLFWYLEALQENEVNYLTITQLHFIRYYILENNKKMYNILNKKIKLDRNTILIGF